MSAEKVTRRHLPHWYMPNAAHFITYRLAGTIPQAVLLDLRHQRDLKLRTSPLAGPERAPYRERVHKQFFVAYDRVLDENREISFLADRNVAGVLRDNLYHHRETKYHLFAYCIMPNHVHVLLQPIDVRPAGSLPHVGQAILPGTSGPPKLRQAGSLSHEPDERPDKSSPLAKIMHSLKSYTANEANQILNRRGETFWQSESYDHWVRDDEELERIVEYIAFNPVKAGLACAPHDWEFCSAYDRFKDDGEQTGWLRQP